MDIVVAAVVDGQCCQCSDAVSLALARIPHTWPATVLRGFLNCGQTTNKCRPTSTTSICKLAAPAQPISLAVAKAVLRTPIYWLNLLIFVALVALAIRLVFLTLNIAVYFLFYFYSI